MDLFGFNLEFPSKTDSFGDKSFYDIESNDLKEFWESELDTGIGDALKVDDDWSPAEGFLEVKPQVVLHDRLMSDAMLTGTAPIKAEHSYCTRLLNSDDESSDDSIIALHNLADELEEECFPVIPLKMEPDDDEDDDDNNGSKRCRTESPIIVIKEEPMSEEESLPSSRPTSPQQTASSIISCRVRASSDKKNMKNMKQDSRNVIFARNGVQQTRVLMPHMNIKVDSSSGSGFSLPPTPPSSTSSDSETGNVSPERSSPSRKLFLSIPQPTARQPIQTPLISSQPKGSTGTLTLTEEEKRTLIAEGYPIPTKLPLSKAEEKSLKKIRRKIKNKISAQESRRKKKEYMDALERKVEMLSSQNSEYRKKISNLEDANSSLLSQLQKLQQIVGGIQTLPNVNFAFKPNTVAKK